MKAKTNTRSMTVRTWLGFSLAALALTVQGAVTDLATEPFSLSKNSQPGPNIMFVLDDSLSMEMEYLPDWAGPEMHFVSGVLTVKTPHHRYYNGAFNALAYNSGVRYKPPVMYDASGALDTTTYPSQTGESTATGGDASATAAARNWRAVKKDAYGRQAPGTANVEGFAAYYLTTPGEHCKEETLRNCVASSVPTTIGGVEYKYPARLRWCTDDSTSRSNTALANPGANGAGKGCQATNIDPAAGITAYQQARFPAPQAVPLIVTNGGKVTSIKVRLPDAPGPVTVYKEILSEAVDGASSTELAKKITEKINACTYRIAGNCEVYGFRSVHTGVTAGIYAPGAVHGEALTVATANGATVNNSNWFAQRADASNQDYVPGTTVFTVIHPSVNSYPKTVDRDDCAGASCTYAEEMTNYANWYTYYRSRMQMMKTAASYAFAGVSEKFRIGYFTLNNGSATDFINVAAFDGAQRHAWYQKFFYAKPFGETPLRTGLANAGKYYANKLGALNGVTAVDPMQYSCQQNYTILSTDGYWNDTAAPTQLDGTTPIGQQDGDDDRPYYDGAKQNRNVSWTEAKYVQNGEVQLLYEQQITQKQKTTKPAMRSYTLTTTVPNACYQYPVMTKTAELLATEVPLETRINPLKVTTTTPSKTETLYWREVRPIKKFTNKVEKKTYSVQERQRKLTRWGTRLAKTTTPVKQTVTPLIRETSSVSQQTKKLQVRYEIRVGESTWTWGSYLDVPSGDTCKTEIYATNRTVDYGGIAYEARAQQCDWGNDGSAVTDLPTCTKVDGVKDGTGAWQTSPQPVYCWHQAATSAVVSGPSFTNVPGAAGPSEWKEIITYRYGTGTDTTPAFRPVTTDNLAACSPAHNPPASGASKHGPGITCDWDTAHKTTVDVPAGTYTNVIPAGYSGYKVEYGYNGTESKVGTGLGSCTVVRGGSGPTFSEASEFTCEREAWGSFGAGSGTGGSCTYATLGASLEEIPDRDAQPNGEEYKASVGCRHNLTATTQEDDCEWKNGLSDPVITSGTVYTARQTCAYTVAGRSEVPGPHASCTQGSPSSGTNDGDDWEDYDSCILDDAPTLAATAAGDKNLTSCTSQAATTVGATTSVTNLNTPAYAGKQVTCMTHTPVTTPLAGTCTPSDGGVSGTSPFFSYTKPIVSCGNTSSTVPDQTSCTPSATVSCAYQGWSSWSGISPSCKPEAEVANTSVQGVEIKMARECKHVAGTPTPAASCTALKETADADGTIYTARRCTYDTSNWSGWVNAGGDCTWRSPDPVAHNTTVTEPARQCSYQGWQSLMIPGHTNIPGIGVFDGNCVAYVGYADAGTPAETGKITGYRWDRPRIEHSGVSVDTTYSPAAEPKSPCVIPSNHNVPVTDSFGVTRTYVYSCAHAGATTVDAGSCSAQPGTNPTTSQLQDEISCAEVTGSKTPVAPNCATPSGVLDANGFDSGGKKIDCKVTNKTTGATDPGPHNAATFIINSSLAKPVASCTAGTNASTKVQTRCFSTDMPRTRAAEAVSSASCTCAGSPCTDEPANAGNLFTSRVCTRHSSTSVVMGCKAQAETGPAWQTITCTDAGGGTYNTLADVAAYYYKTDLRTDALGNCTGVSGQTLCTSNPNELNNVPSSGRDSNTAQHMTTFTLGVGASGYVPYTENYLSASSGDFHAIHGVSPHRPIDGINADPANGLCSWQSTGHCNWPVPTADKQTTIDDLWHAGVNGRGGYFSAANPQSLAASIRKALAEVTASSSMAAAAVVSNPVLSPGDNYVFGGSYKTGEWSGEVIRFSIDPVTGALSTTIDWSAQSKVDTMNWATRKIYTFDSGAANTLKDFTAANFGSHANFKASHVSDLTQVACSANACPVAKVPSCPNDGETVATCTVALVDVCPEAEVLSCLTDKPGASGNKLVDFLRGDRSNEEGLANDNGKYFRRRSHLLGDVVNAETVYVPPPAWRYADPGYATFAENNKSRKKIVLAPANDGMLHAFDAENGNELWAYVPKAVLPWLYKLADKRYEDRHRYFVDSTPIIADVCVNHCGIAASAEWKTIAVGGLGRGGRAYYALDITDTENPKGLWEFTDDNLGYTYGTPQVGKLSDGTWVVAMPSGYNNIPNDEGSGGDGVGRLFVVKANTGLQITRSPISTDIGSAGTPSGLARITGPVHNSSTNPTLLGVYGGDLLGNLWRFDVNDEVGPTGLEAQLLATLKDGAGSFQPVTTKPIISKVQGLYIVVVGTGQYLDASDADTTSPSTTTKQSIYGVIDRRASGGIASDAIYDNPGESPRLATQGVNTKGFLVQKVEEKACTADDARSGLCVVGEKRLFVKREMTTCDAALSASTGCAVGTQVETDAARLLHNPDYSGGVHNGWVLDLPHAGERVDVQPTLGLGLLVVNTNAPSAEACIMEGRGYQYWLDYKSGSFVQEPGNPGIIGLQLADSRVNAPALFSTGRLHTLTPPVGCVGPDCMKVKNPPLPPESSITQRTAWRELIRE